MQDDVRDKLDRMVCLLDMVVERTEELMDARGSTIQHHTARINFTKARDDLVVAMRQALEKP